MVVVFVHMSAHKMRIISMHFPLDVFIFLFIDNLKNYAHYHFKMEINSDKNNQHEC